MSDGGSAPAAPAQPEQGVVFRQGLIISGVGGTPGATAYVLTSTNLALSNWTLTATVALDGAGALSYTNAIDPAQPQQYFRVQMP